MMYIIVVSYLYAHSIPTWMRPYACLSNGEQARSRLARQIKDNAVIDDLTSVVNRHAAWAMSSSISRFIRRRNFQRCYTNLNV